MVLLPNIFESKNNNNNLVCGGEKNFVFIRSLVINYFKTDSILLGGIGVKKFQALYHKAF